MGNNYWSAQQLGQDLAGNKPMRGGSEGEVSGNWIYLLGDWRNIADTGIDTSNLAGGYPSAGSQATSQTSTGGNNAYNDVTVNQDGGQSGVDVQAQIDELNAQTDAFIDQMLAEAQGDLKLALEQLEAQHEFALGTDDQARAEFFEEVASKLEEKIGRIPYDYKRFTSRELQDYARGVERTNESKRLALERLAQDEQLLQQKLGQEETQATEEQASSLNKRGLVSGPQGEMEGLGGQFEDRLQQALGRRRTALERALGRDKENVKMGAERTLADLLRNKNRNLEDLKTQARRGGLDAQYAYNFGQKGAQKSFEDRKAALERKRQEQKLYNPSYAGYLESLSYG